MVGRPKEFERSEALASALEVFWTKGYESTSVQNLVDAMGVNRGSLYDTFGDKHALFIEAVEYYLNDHVSKMVESLGAGNSPLAGIRGVFNTLVDHLTSGNCCRGCLITNAAVELAPHNEDVADIVGRSLKTMEKAFRDQLNQAVIQGELSAESDTRMLARFLVTSLQGVVVMGKASAGKAVLKDAVRAILSVLKNGD